MILNCISLFVVVFLNCYCISFHVGGVTRLVKRGRVFVVVGGARRGGVCNDFLYLERFPSRVARITNTSITTHHRHHHFSESRERGLSIVRVSECVRVTF